MIMGTTVLISVGSFFIGKNLNTIINKTLVTQIEFHKKEVKLTPTEFSEILKKYKFIYPEVVMAQAYIETGLGSAGVGRTNKNLFGMRYPTTRVTLAIGEEYGFAVFDNYKESVLDYKLWQTTVFGVNNNISLDEYYQTLDMIYSENKNYSLKVKQVIKSNNIENYFK